MKVAMFPSPSGSAVWRLIDPGKYMRRKGVDVEIPRGGITRQVAEDFDVYTLQNCIDRDGIALLYEYQQEHGKKIVVDVDDLWDINPENPHKVEHDIVNASETIQATIKIADLVTTTNEYLAERIAKLNKNVVVLPNFMDMDRWDIKPKLKNEADTIRIGWAGSMTHIKDLELIEKPLRRICAEFPQVRLIFVGDTRVRELLKGLPVEVMLGVPFPQWPARLRGLRLDIGLAPLQDNEFNRCKSNIKWQEYSVNAIPGVYSKTVYFDRMFDGRIGMIAENEDQWYWNIRNFIVSKELRENISKAAYAEVGYRYSLTGNQHNGEPMIMKWVDAYNSLFR